MRQVGIMEGETCLGASEDQNLTLIRFRHPFFLRTSTLLPAG